MSELTPLRRVQLMELDIFKEIVRICNENKLTYYISGGTYLGAVRHKGFIPWDDDMDVAMPRRDYNKFLKIAPKELKEDLYLVHYSVCKTNLQHAQICNRTKHLREKNSMIEKIVDVFVDVFPLDGIPSRGVRQTLHKVGLLYYRMMYVYSVFDEYVSINKPNRPLHEKILIEIGKTGIPQKILNREKRIKKFDRFVAKYDFYKSDYVLNFSGRYKFKSIFNRKKVYAAGRMYEFEGLLFNGPYDYDFYLKQIYGNYMKLPPRNKRNWHESEVIED